MHAQAGRYDRMRRLPTKQHMKIKELERTIPQWGNNMCTFQKVTKGQDRLIKKSDKRTRHGLINQTIIHFIFYFIIYFINQVRGNAEINFSSRI